MYPKLLALVIFIALLALGTLVIRQQRLEAMHQIVRSHAQINHDRQAIWDYQVRIAGKLDPESLVKAAERQGIRLRPMVDPQVLPEGVENFDNVSPEDGRFVNDKPTPGATPNMHPRLVNSKPVTEVKMVQVSAGANGGQPPIMIPVVDPEPNTRLQQQRIAPRR